ncbi:unnamed protein product [Orchesella dallaii]|uniref:Uncharacterized protein n=1 Tax=Orchesella dallaii TaxID=48710 RepID=A0ABP1S7V7_9HEXA
MIVFVPHLNWLHSFQTCFNFVLALGNVRLAPQSNSPSYTSYVFYHSNLTLNKYPVAYFNRWTTCLTLSFIIVEEDSKTFNVELKSAFRKLGFSPAANCVKFYNGFCDRSRKQWQNDKQIPLVFQPLTLFFITKQSSKLHQNFKSFQFVSLYATPFFLKPFRFVYDFFDTSPQINQKPTEIVFICRYCNWNVTLNLPPEVSVLENRLIKEFPIQCPTELNSCQSELQSIYLSATGDGKKFLYDLKNNGNKYLLLRLTEPLKELYATKSTMEILKLGMGLNLIMLSIMLQYIPLPIGLKLWPKTYLYPGIGILKDTMISSQLEIDSNFFNFLTCHREESSVNMYSLLQPFQMPVWYSIIITGVAIATAMHFLFAFVRHLKTSNFVLKELSVVSISLTLYAMLLGTDFQISNVTSRHFLRKVLITWLLISTILNSAWKGDYVASVIAPKEVTLIDTFSQLHSKNFSLFAVDACYSTFSLEIGCTNFETAVIDWLRKLIGITRVRQMILSYNNTTGSKEFTYSWIKTYKFNTSAQEQMAKLLLQLRRVRGRKLFPFSKYLEQCQKTALVEFNNDIQETLREFKTGNYSRNFRETVYAGKDSLFQERAICIRSNGYSRETAETEEQNASESKLYQQQAVIRWTKVRPNFPIQTRSLLHP